MIEAIREHEISVGHRVVGHNNKCRHIHGHNLVFRFHCTAKLLNGIGMVMDFGDIKELLCEWLEVRYDHKMLLWEEDPILDSITGAMDVIDESIVLVPFNPTAENIALHMLHEVGPRQLEGTGILLYKVEVFETRKCSAVATLEEFNNA